MSGSFEFPFFFSYPPYFTLQPVKDTRERQAALWAALILAYCKHHKLFVLRLDEPLPLFANASIGRALPVEARAAFVGDLVAQGNAEWLDAPAKCTALILWRKIDEWARLIDEFAKTYGLAGSVMTVDELGSGDEVRRTELEGCHREVLQRALKLLESQGRVTLFHGDTPEEEGVKFL